MKPLTIEELKALQMGDWVWIVCNNQGNYTKKIFCDENEFVTYKLGDCFKYSDYGTQWLAYKNKEQAEAKGEIVELPYEIRSKVYCVRRNRNLKWVVSRTTISMYLKHSRLLVKCACDSEWHEPKDVFTDKAQAEARLQELRGEK